MPQTQTTKAGKLTNPATRPTDPEGQCCGVKSNGGRARVNIDIAGIQVQALVDPGSTHTLISDHLYNRLPRLTPLYPAPRLQSASNDDMCLKGICTVKISGIPTDVVVCPDLQVDLLLGTNMFGLHKNLLIDYEGQTVRIGDRIYPADMTQETFPAVQVMSAIPKADSQTINILLKAYEDVFSLKDTPVGLANVPKSEIALKPGAEPQKNNRQYNSHAQRSTVEEHVKQMEKDGVIRPSHSPWASPVLLVGKKDGGIRFCIDYRAVNERTIKDAHPLPRIRDIFDQLAGATIFSTLDLKSAYWQMPMEEKSIPATAFTCHLGLYEFTRLPYGLTNAPGIFQRQMNKILNGLIGKICMVYLDDIVIYSRTEAEHVKHLQQVLDRLRKAKLQLKPSKCHFGLKQLDLLGYRISAAGIETLPEKVSAIRNLAPPDDATGVRSFLGMAGYYRSCIRDFADIAAPLFELTKKNTPFHWGTEHQESFDKLKMALTESPVMAHPKTDEPYTLYTDASNYAVGAILVQEDDQGIERVISFASHKLSGAEKNWATIEKEAYAVIFALKKYHMYLWGAKFEIHTDHKPLLALFKSEVKNSKIQRWAIQISEYGAPIRYHPGKLNIRADMLSRIKTTGQISNIQPKIQPIPVTDPPEVWKTDNIDPRELIQLQRQQFEDQYTGASQDEDGCCYTVENGILYSLAEPHPNAGLYHRLVLPQQYRRQVIDRSHEDVAHSAHAKTLARIQEYYVWPGMRKHVREYISLCTHCNTLSPNKPPHPRGKIKTPPTPFHTWGIDLVGPFKRDNRGRQYLFTAIDHLTGWVEAIPIASKKSALIQQTFMEHIVARYGLPSVLISDNGGEFISQGFKDYLKEFGIEHHLTSPYHPQSNGMTERFNGTIQKILLKLTGGNDRKWSAYLAEALLAYRISQGPSGISPYRAVFGQRSRLPRAPTDGQPEGDRLKAIRTTEKLLHQFRTTQREKYQDAEPRKAKRFPPGTFVSVRVLDPKKAQPHWQPGYTVMSSHDGALHVMEQETGKILRINQDKVREIPFEKDYDEIDPIPQRNQEKTLPPQEARPIPTPTKLSPHATPFMPAAAAINPPKTKTKLEPRKFTPVEMIARNIEWSTWCATVYSTFHPYKPTN